MPGHGSRLLLVLGVSISCSCTGSDSCLGSLFGYLFTMAVRIASCLQGGGGFLFALI